MNLYDLTKGNYRVHRTVSYSEFPKSSLVFETRVTRTGAAEWTTSMKVSGTYDGPTDVIGVENYQIKWSTDSKTLREEGSATLKLSSGADVRTTWVSSITPDEPSFGGFPSAGEAVRVTYSAFRIDGKTMRYDWSGTVEPAQKDN